MADDGLYIFSICSSISSLGFTLGNRFIFQITHHEQPVTGRHVRAGGGIAVDGIVCPVFGGVLRGEGTESMRLVHRNCGRDRGAYRDGSGEVVEEKVIGYQ